MTFAEIDQLIEAMHANGVNRLEWEHLRKGTRLCLTLPESSEPLAPVQRPAPERRSITAPGIGAFVARGGDDGFPPLEDGAAVQAGETLGYIAQGAVLQVLTTPVQGTLVGSLPLNGQVFGHGDAVLHMERTVE
ncbi:MAG: hypothetical protein ACK4HF_13920 [Paracoccaceae bacterium]